MRGTRGGPSERTPCAFCKGTCCEEQDARKGEEEEEEEEALLILGESFEFSCANESKSIAASIGPR